MSVMLFNSIKMFLNVKTKRFLINFQSNSDLSQLADLDSLEILPFIYFLSLSILKNATIFVKTLKI
jgi:hypothetical protein